MPAATLTPREVAELSGTPRHVVEKAIEERVLSVRMHARAVGVARRMLPIHAVAYAAIVSKLELKLTAAHKKRLFEALSHMKSEQITRARVEVAPAVKIDVGRLVGDVLQRAERYRATRDASIKIDARIMGGTPVLRGTRITVYSLLGRIEHGDTIDGILADNPDLEREAVEAAITYARTHPLMGRPGGRPWSEAA